MAHDLQFSNCIQIRAIVWHKHVKRVDRKIFHLKKEKVCPVLKESGCIFKKKYMKNLAKSTATTARIF